MHPERVENRFELPQERLDEAPIIEAGFDPDHVSEFWPKEIASNEEFVKQIETRKELKKSLDDVLNSLPRPDLAIEQAIDQGYVTEAQATRLYSSLNELLESSNDYKRIVLYLPFELLPGRKWRSDDEKLQRAVDRFNQTYMKAWTDLLSVHDVRAHFVDGDIPDFEQQDADLPKVVKAAHLIPKLAEKGMLEVQDAIQLIKDRDDQVLRNSIADTLPVLADLGMLGQRELKAMKESNDHLIRNMAIIIESGIEAQTKQEAVEPGPKTISFVSVQQSLSQEFTRIDSADYGDATQKRIKWLKQKKKQETIDSVANDISQLISLDQLRDEEIDQFLGNQSKPASQQALVEGIRKAIESTAGSDPEGSEKLYDKYKETLLALWHKDDLVVQETLAKNFRRLNQLGIVEDKQLQELNINVPKLAGPFSENLEMIKTDLQDIRKMIASIESDPELSKSIYPVALVFGSGLKGYGEKKADIDIAVFVKPGTEFSQRSRIQQMLKGAFKHDKIGDGIVEFWLDQDGDQLRIHFFEEADASISLGEPYWTHVLFGAAWEGKAEAIRELREKLIVPYLYETDDPELRRLYLNEIERDALQYRLMHKGYERFYPPCSGIHTPHSDEIDGNSMFWDSGYRQLATKLYARRVFLPKISAQEKN